jgi:hypothetical protein
MMGLVLVDSKVALKVDAKVAYQVGVTAVY